MINNIVIKCDFIQRTYNLIKTSLLRKRCEVKEDVVSISNIEKSMLRWFGYTNLENTIRAIRCWYEHFYYLQAVIRKTSESIVIKSVNMYNEHRDKHTYIRYLLQ